MVEIEQNTVARGRSNTPPKVKEVPFHNERLNALGIEPMSFETLRGKVPPAILRQPERVGFFMLMFVTGGQGIHGVDFTEWAIGPGSVVFVRPGQVQQWHPECDYRAELVLIAPTALPYRSGAALAHEVGLLGLDDLRPSIALDAAGRAEFAAGLAALRDDFARYDGSPLDVSLIQHGLLTLLLRLARLQNIAVPSGAAQPEYGIYRRFLRVLEEHFATARGLRFYASALGYSESSLSRACQTAVGRPAKQLIDRRIALEAQRLLAHSDASVTTIAGRLGFSESTNFVKFFRRTVGLTPSAFRRDHAAGAD